MEMNRLAPAGAHILRAIQMAPGWKLPVPIRHLPYFSFRCSAYRNVILRPVRTAEVCMKYQKKNGND